MKDETMKTVMIRTYELRTILFIECEKVNDERWNNWAKAIAIDVSKFERNGLLSAVLIEWWPEIVVFELDMPIE